MKDNQHFSIGREMFLPKTIGVYLSGLTSPDLVKRVKLMETSGIRDWHSAVVRNWMELSTTISHNKPTKATMSGNVSIIFLILPVGFAPAMIGYIFELIMFRLARAFLVAHPRINNETVSVSSAITTMLTEIVNLACLHMNISIEPNKLKSG